MAKQITNETKVVFTIKGFIGTIISILGIFVGFHTMVIQPRLDAHEERFEQILTKMNDEFGNVNTQLMEMNNGIGALNGNIEGINNRFRDLNTARQNSGNSQGSFGAVGGTTANSGR